MDHLKNLSTPVLINLASAWATAAASAQLELNKRFAEANGITSYYPAYRPARPLPQADGATAPIGDPACDLPPISVFSRFASH